VRLKALEALRDSTSDDAVRQVLLNTLKHDTNPGVRVEAVNLLVSSLEKPEVRGAEVVAMPGMSVAGDGNMMPAMARHEASDSSLASVIRELATLQHNDPSQYVRMRSAAALRQLSARGDQ